VCRQKFEESPLECSFVTSLTFPDNRYLKTQSPQCLSLRRSRARLSAIFRNHQSLFVRGTVAKRISYGRARNSRERR